jgi:hypothetical protein
LVNPRLARALAELMTAEAPVVDGCPVLPDVAPTAGSVSGALLERVIELEHAMASGGAVAARIAALEHKTRDLKRDTKDMEHRIDRAEMALDLRAGSLSSDDEEDSDDDFAATGYHLEGDEDATELREYEDEIRHNPKDTAFLDNDDDVETSVQDESSVSDDSSVIDVDTEVADLARLGPVLKSSEARIALDRQINIWGCPLRVVVVQATWILIWVRATKSKSSPPLWGSNGGIYEEHSEWRSLASGRRSWTSCRLHSSFNCYLFP